MRRELAARCCACSAIGAKSIVAARNESRGWLARVPTKAAIRRGRGKMMRNSTSAASGWSDALRVLIDKERVTVEMPELRDMKTAAAGRVAVAVCLVALAVPAFAHEDDGMATECIELDGRGDFWQLVNTCNVRLDMAWCLEYGVLSALGSPSGA